MALNKIDKKIDKKWKTNFKNFWKEVDADQSWIIDFSGRIINKSAYGNVKSDYAFSLDHVYPESKNGSNKIENLNITHMETNEQKGSKINGVIQHNYPDNYNVITEFEVRNHIFINDKKCKVIFIKKQYNNRGDIFQENSYYYNSVIYWKESNFWYCSRIDLEESIKYNAIIIENSKYECGINDKINKIIPYEEE